VSTAKETGARPPHRVRGWLLALAETAALTVALFVGVETVVAQPYTVEQVSMEQSLLPGERVVVDKLTPRFEPYRRGDIVVFIEPGTPSTSTPLIKRVIGLPGDIVAMQHKRLLINGHRVDYVPSGVAADALGDGRVLPAQRSIEALGDHPYVQWLTGVDTAADFAPVAIPADRYLMLGDNRDNSADSRFIGLVPRSALIARAERVLVSADITGNWLPRFGRFGKSLVD